MSSVKSSVSVDSLTGLLQSRAAAAPSSIALRAGDETLSYAELAAGSARAAAALAADGLASGSRIGMLDKNSLVCIELLFAAARSAAVLVPLNWRLSPAELADVITDAQIELLVVGAEFLPVIDELRASGLAMPATLLADPDGSQAGALTYAGWRDRDLAAAPILDSDAQRVVLQIYTSGTTGRFKGVMLTEGVMTAHLGELATMMGYTERSVNLTAMPLFHVAGIGGVLLGLVNGAETVVLRDADLDVIANVLPAKRVTHAFLVPVVVFSLLERRPAIDWSRLQTVMYGASAISVSLLERAIREIGCSFIQIYGLTESRGASTLLPASAHDPHRPELLKSCGRALPWVDIRVVDATTAEDVAQGQSGELWIRSPQNMAGYWNAPAASAEVLLEGGWLRTGDIGHVDDEGYFYIDDRLKDMIVSGGENIYPAEIERVLQERADVADVAVIGIPHERWGETPAALIVVASGSPVPSTEEIISYCRSRLARYKCPSVVEIVDELPRNASGKVLKRQLREEFWRGQDRRVH